MICGRLVCIGTALIVSACTGAANPQDDTSAQEVLTAYDLPAYLPLTLIDQHGYDTGGEKVVLFGAKVGDTFEVRSADDDMAVYTGSVKTTDGIGSGQFTSFQAAGDYYIYTDAVGSSYTFRIGENIAKETAHDAFRSFYLHRCDHTTNARLQTDPSLEVETQGGWHTDEQGNRDVVTACHALRDLLLSVEINEEAYGDATGIPESENGIPDVLDEARYEIEWLLKMQAASGGVYAGVLTGGNENSANLTLTETESLATAAFAGVAARFAYLYDGYDAAYAQTVLQHAASAWNEYSDTGAPLQDRAGFSAAAELYRATGDRKYENVLSTFFNKDNFTALLATDDEIFYGSVTYLKTTQPVNVTVQNEIRTVLQETTEEIVARAEASPYFVSDTEVDALLMDMCRLAVMNDLSYRHAYVTMMEDHVHYLFGRNPEAVNYVTDDTEYTYRDAGLTGIRDMPARCAKLVLLLTTG